MIKISNKETYVDSNGSPIRVAIFKAIQSNLVELNTKYPALLSNYKEGILFACQKKISEDGKSMYRFNIKGYDEWYDPTIPIEDERLKALDDFRINTSPEGFLLTPFLMYNIEMVKDYLELADFCIIDNIMPNLNVVAVKTYDYDELMSGCALFTDASLNNNVAICSEEMKILLKESSSVSVETLDKVFENVLKGNKYTAVEISSEDSRRLSYIGGFTECVYRGDPTIVCGTVVMRSELLYDGIFKEKLISLGIKVPEDATLCRVFTKMRESYDDEVLSVGNKFSAFNLKGTFLNPSNPPRVAYRVDGTCVNVLIY